MIKIYIYYRFFVEFIRRPKELGAVVPSSSFLCKEMISNVDWKKINAVAELGAGSGVLTKFIIKKKRQTARLDVFEINKNIINSMESFDKNDNINVYVKSAVELSGEYDVIFSGLPLLSFPKMVADDILKKIYESLTDDGFFIQFQYSLFMEKRMRQYFTWERKFVLYNIPPAFVYICKKCVSENGK